MVLIPNYARLSSTHITETGREGRTTSISTLISTSNSERENETGFDVKHWKWLPKCYTQVSTGTLLYTIQCIRVKSRFTNMLITFI